VAGIGLGGLYGVKYGRRVKIVVNRHVVKREMHCRVKGGRGRSKLTCAKKPNKAVRKAAQNMVWSKSVRFKDVRLSAM